MPQTRTSKPVPTTTPAETTPTRKGTPKPTAFVDAPSTAPARPRRKGRVTVPTNAQAAPVNKAAQPAGRKSTVTSTNPGKKGGPTKLSALDAAAKVLEDLKGTEARDGIGANDLIERMQRSNLWTSPGGKTPAATLYAAMTREITAKKGAARFARVSPGRFAFKGAAKVRPVGGGK